LSGHGNEIFTLNEKTNEEEQRRSTLN